MSRDSVRLRPLADRLVVRVSESSEKTPGGIILPDVAREKPRRGEVLAVGPGKVLDNGERASMSVKVGDVVLYARYSGNEVKAESGDVLILNENDLLAVVER